MPLLFFHLASPSGINLDDEGSYFGTVEEAYLDTYRAVLEMSPDMVRARSNPLDYSFEVTDPSGLHVFNLSFEEVLTAGRHGASPRSSLKTRYIGTSGLLPEA